MFQLFNHHHTAAASDDETITVRIISTGGFFWCFVVFGGECAHCVKLTRHFPAQFFAAASKDDVLFAQLDLLNRAADAVCRSCTRGADGVVHTVDFERRCEARRNCRRHRFGHDVRTNRFQAARTTHSVCAEYLRFRRTTGTCDQAHARIVLINIFFQTSIFNSLLH
ncbi:hypothetical protein D3C71_1208390 [compost metagenome]